MALNDSGCRYLAPDILKESVMAAQMADKGHPALQTVSADRFGKVLEEMGKNTRRPARF